MCPQMWKKNIKAIYHIKHVNYLKVQDIWNKLWSIYKSFVNLYNVSGVRIDKWMASEDYF